MFAYLYWTVGLLLYLFSLPLILLKQRNPRYQERLPAQYFLKHNSPFQKEGIWFHSCSLGETRGLTAIIECLSETVNMTAITNTGFAEAKRLASGEARYLPFEIFLPWWMKRQKILVVTESEYWYLLFYLAKRKRMKTVLVNARISDMHWERYQRFRWFYAKVLGQIDQIFAQTTRDKERLEILGAKRVTVTGNSKLANLPKTTKALQKPEGRMIVAASTHRSEELLVLDAWERAMGRLVIVPRHPERFDEVDMLIREWISDRAISYHRYTEKSTFDADIVLIDKMGELVNIYAIADVVILGGSFVTYVGGHNPVEVASFKNILITGEFVYNERAIYESLEHYHIIKERALAGLLQQLDTLKPCRIKQSGDIEPIIAYIKKETEGEECVD